MIDILQCAAIALLVWCWWMDMKSERKMLDALAKWMVRQEEINSEVAEWIKERESTDGR